jgi:hypothetical protein
MALLCSSGRRRYNTNKNRRQRSCWRNPFFVFFLSFAALGTLRFRVRTKRAATAILRQHQQNHNSNNNNKILSPVAEGQVVPAVTAATPVEFGQAQKLKQKLQLRPRQKLKQKQPQPQSVTTSRTMIKYVLTEKGTTESGRAFERYKAVYADPKTAPLSLSGSALSPEAQQQEPLVAVTVKEWAQSLAHNSVVTAPELSAVLRQSSFAAFFFETKGVSADTADSVPFEFVLVDAPQLADFINNKADPTAFSNQLESKKCAAQSIGCRFQNLSGDAVLVAPKPLVSLPSASSPSSSSPLASISALVSASAADANSRSNNSAQQQLLPYAHLANFVRQAPAHQVTGLWRMAASAYLDALAVPNNKNSNNNEEGKGIGNTGSSSKNNKILSNLKKHKKKSSGGGAAKPVWFSTSGMGVAWLHFRLDERPKYYTYRAFAEEA